jgi:hypothetical protein
MLGEYDLVPDGIDDGRSVGGPVIVDVGSLVGDGVGGNVQGASNAQHGKSYAQSTSPFGHGNDCRIGK